MEHTEKSRNLAARGVVFACVLLLACAWSQQVLARRKPPKKTTASPTTAVVQVAPEQPPPAPDAGAAGADSQSLGDPGAPPERTLESPSDPQAPQAAAGPAADAPSTPASVAPTQAPTGDAELVALRDELGTIMDELVQARARAAIVGKALFHTRVVVKVQNLAAPEPALGKLVLKLDGAPIYRGDGSALQGDAAHQVYEGFIAPGPHALIVDVEQRSREDSAYGYTLHESYRFAVVRQTNTELLLVLDDDSNLAQDFPDDGEGEYDVRTRLRVKTKPAAEK